MTSQEKDGAGRTGKPAGDSARVVAAAAGDLGGPSGKPESGASAEASAKRPEASHGRAEAGRSSSAAGTQSASADEGVQEAEGWLRDRERAQQSAGYGREIDEAVRHLIGTSSASGAMHIGGVYIQGDVHNLTGDIVGGAKQAGARESGYLGDIVTGQVASDILAKIERSFVQPECFQRLRDRLSEGGIALLHAPGGWGRTTAGLLVLSQLCTEVWKLSPDTDLRDIDLAKLRDNAGYLIEIRALDKLARLNVPHLEKLSQDISARQIKLLATTDDVDVAHLDSDFGVAGGPRPDLAVVLRKQFQVNFAGYVHAGALEAGPDAFLGTEEIQHLIAELVDESFSMRRVAELSSRLLMVAAGRTTAQEVRAHLIEQTQQDFTDWITTQDDYEQRALLMALATLDGMPYHLVNRLAKSLVDAIRAAEGSKEEKPKVFGPTRAERLARARAEVFDSFEQTPYGHVRVDAVRFRNETYPRRVLEWMWQEHDTVRPIIIDWLQRAGVDRNRQVRVRAAAVVGLLALNDFEHVRQEVILPWANEGSNVARDSAVAALRIPGQDAALSAHVVRMIRDWAGPQNPLARQLTATRALGASVGRLVRADALSLLAKFADRDNLLLCYAISDSIAELFLASEAGAQSDVIRTLVEWTERTTPISRRTVGTFCFLRLAFDYLAENEDDHISWPALLWLATKDGMMRDWLATLWARSLRTPPYVPVAHDAFASWVEMAADSPEVTVELASFVKHAATDDHVAQRLRHTVTRMARADGKKATADTLLKALNGSGQS